MSNYFGSGSGASPVSSAASGSSVTTPTLFNDVILTANTEQSYALPAGTKQFEVLNQSVSELKIAYSVGTSGTVYKTMYRGTSFSILNLDSTATIVLFYQSATAGGRLEVESWA